MFPASLLPVDFSVSVKAAYLTSAWGFLVQDKYNFNFCVYATICITFNVLYFFHQPPTTTITRFLTPEKFLA